MINSKAYKHIQNRFNLILFADAANYNKSGSKSIWSIFSALVELPPALRESYENIVFHCSWSGSNPDFNVLLGEYNDEINKVNVIMLFYSFLFVN